MDRKETEARLLDLAEEMGRAAAEYGSRGSLTVWVNPHCGEDVGAYVMVRNEYWSVDAERPIDAYRTEVEL